MCSVGVSVACMIGNPIIYKGLWALLTVGLVNTHSPASVLLWAIKYNNSNVLICDVLRAHSQQFLVQGNVELKGDLRVSFGVT